MVQVGILYDRGCLGDGVGEKGMVGARSVGHFVVAVVETCALPCNVDNKTKCNPTNVGATCDKCTENSGPGGRTQSLEQTRKDKLHQRSQLVE